MDTKPFEIQAEDLVKHKLLKYDFLVVKPTFDVEGADLLIVKDVSKKVTPFLKIQSKGRKVNKGSNITIHKRFVKDNFIVFLYVELKASKEDYLYAFFKDDIEKWNDIGTEFQLNIPKKFYEKQEYIEKMFDKNLAVRLENLLLKQDFSTLIKTSDSIIIDGIFLEKAVNTTVKFYKKMYPDKEYYKPNIDKLIEQFCKWTHIEMKRELNCYLLYSKDFGLENIVEIGDLTVNGFLNGEVEKTVGQNYNLYKMKTSDIISFKIEEQLDRLINTENVVLIADDQSYCPYLTQLEKKGMEIKILQMKVDFGSRMYHEFQYADIMYPIGSCIGLEKFEL